MKRIMGLDYGSKTVGVAISDALLLTAQPVETIWRKSESKLRKTLARIDWLIEEYDVGKIVLGLPVHMNTDIGDRALKALEFKAALEKRTGLEVVMMDERLTTVEAMEVLSEAGVKSGDKKQYVDKLAAVFILQDYLNELDSKRSGS
ncbi:MAG: Holliday junction resolvase RuvX [Candidatus Alectryocaccobium sp.]